MRGARSGLGVALFERGGFMLDAGRGPATSLPPIVSHLPFPADWRVVLLLDDQPSTAPMARPSAKLSPRCRRFRPRPPPRFAAARSCRCCPASRRQISPPSARGERDPAPARRPFRARPGRRPLHQRARRRASRRRWSEPARSASAKAPGGRPASPSRAIPTRPRTRPRARARGARRVEVAGSRRPRAAARIAPLV